MFELIAMVMLSDNCLLQGRIPAEERMHLAVAYCSRPATSPWAAVPEECRTSAFKLCPSCEKAASPAIVFEPIPATECTRLMKPFNIKKGPKPREYRRFKECVERQAKNRKPVTAPAFKFVRVWCYSDEKSVHYKLVR
jgi:hypothetical protein